MEGDQAAGNDRERRLIRSLAEDPFFKDWTEASRSFSRRDLDEAIAIVLGTHDGIRSLAPGARERAMARLALFQVIGGHLTDGPVSWEELLARLSPREMQAVEELLGEMTLSEFLD